MNFEGIITKLVDELDLSGRSNNYLANKNIATIGDLVIKTEAELIESKNLAQKT